jgi:hypothetical protein
MNKDPSTDIPRIDSDAESVEEALGIQRVITRREREEMAQHSLWTKRSTSSTGGCARHAEQGEVRFRRCGVSRSLDWSARRRAGWTERALHQFTSWTWEQSAGSVLQRASRARPNHSSTVIPLGSWRVVRRSSQSRVCSPRPRLRCSKRLIASPRQGRYLRSQQHARKSILPCNINDLAKP